MIIITEANDQATRPTGCWMHQYCNYLARGKETTDQMTARGELMEKKQK
jgi:hypothetical protein